MFGIGSAKSKEDKRYYLLPGMGRSNRRKHRQILIASLLAGLVISALFAGVLWLMNR
jgi:hypothetical protein